MKTRICTLSFVVLLVCMICTSCGDLFGPAHSIVGTWGMASGGIKAGGEFTELPERSSYYKIMEFREDGTFTETCDNCEATGTYSQSGSIITYQYTKVEGSGPEYFAIHDSGAWTYYFWNDVSFTLYDFSSTEVSMTFRRIE